MAAPSLNNLAPEILGSIPSFLPDEDLLSLVQTSKYIASTCMPYLWSTLVITEPAESLYEFRDLSPLYRLSELVDQFGVDAVGLQHTRTVRIISLQDTFSKRAETVKNGFHKLLGDLIESGRIHPRKLQLKDSSRFVDRDGNCFDPNSPRLCIDLLRRLITYSKTKNPSEFSMELDVGTLPPFIKAGLVTPLLLTKLSMRQVLRNRYVAFRWSRYIERYWEDMYEIDDNFGEELTVLTQLLTEAVNLRELSIFPESKRYGPGPLSDLSEPLKELQAAVNGLKKLEALTIVAGCQSDGGGVFFHPSFFLSPPENCRSVKYGSTVSIAWWRKFAAHPFTGVEELTLCVRKMSPRFFGWMTEGEDEEMVGRWRTRNKIQLGSVALTGLKKLTLSGDRHAELNGYPTDLETCIYIKNRGLDEEYRKKMREEVIERFHSQMRSNFDIGIAHCADHIAAQHFEYWMEQNPIEQTSAEECLEAMKIEKDRYIMEFMEMLSKWGGNNLHKFRFEEHDKSGSLNASIDDTQRSYI
ncbi:hypothetical protein TWF730_006722 [Orbilia blumenaviensis]|uniref:F-box domain-containing protein n=1 Tax=Orbilia blumenaviensis TaxID=1796055 RepID=A0AAV9VGA5_9PEZI